MRIKVSLLSNTVLMYYGGTKKGVKNTSGLNDAVQVSLKGLESKSKVKKENTRIMSISNKQKSTIKKLGKLLTLEGDVKKYCKLVTITTNQHINGLTDGQCKKVLSKFIDRQKIKSYMYTCERQKNGSIHFHVIYNEDKKIDIVSEVVKLNKALPSTGTNVINVAKLTGNKLKSFIYITKYATKENSSFTTKPSQISYELLQYYKSKISQYEYFLNNDNSEPFFQALEDFPPLHLRSENFYSIYIYDDKAIQSLFDAFGAYREGLQNNYEKLSREVDLDMQTQK